MIVYGEPHSPLPPRVAQRLEQGTHNLLVVGSNPTPRIVSTRLRRTISLPVHAHRTGVLAPPVVGRSFQLRGVIAPPPLAFPSQKPNLSLQLLLQLHTDQTKKP